MIERIVVVGATGLISAPVARRVLGTATVAAAAARHGLGRISYLTGSLVREQYGPKIPEHRAKLAAEQAIQDSGVPSTFFRPTYFTNTLPRHVQGPTIVALGRHRRALHPACGEDFAVQVARAFATPAAANRDFYVHGPEKLTLIRRSAFTARSLRRTSSWS